jgi:ATP-dependent DNA helicase RecG
MYTPQDIDDILEHFREGEVLEFKTAERGFSKEHRSDYCAAIANMGGGKLLLGVTNDRKVSGTSCYEGRINQIPQEVYQNIGITVAVQEVDHPNGRVVIFDIPKRSTGKPVRSNGEYTYPIRRGESLGEMDEDMFRSVINELTPDFSASIVDGFPLNDLDLVAVENFRKLRSAKTENPRVLTEPIEQVLADAGLLIDGKCTFACLVLLGKSEKIKRLAPQSEIIFEWRSDAGKIPHDFRKTWTGPYFANYDEIWEAINARNVRVPYQEGFIQHEIFAFDEKACREAVNNAVTHRDYMITTGSIFIHASPERFSVTSPGGLLPQITLENIREKSAWRNRTIADALEHTKLVERSGQGIDDIFEISIEQGKGIPDFDGTDAYQLCINIPAIVRDLSFVKFLETVVNEKGVILSLDEMIELERLREQGADVDIAFKEKFLKFGIVEKIGKTSGTKYILSHRYYKHENKLGKYTRLKGLSRESRKELILKHIEREGKGNMSEFMEAFPDLKRSDISNILDEMKKDEEIYFDGKTRRGVWKVSNKDGK